MRLRPRAYEAHWTAGEEGGMDAADRYAGWSRERYGAWVDPRGRDGWWRRLLRRLRGER